MSGDKLFYNEYEHFYEMAEHSDAFRYFCKDAFGDDFSQDGFSDIKQIDRIVEHIPTGRESHMLDVGCGNGREKRHYCTKRPSGKKAAPSGLIC